MTKFVNERRASLPIVRDSSGEAPPTSIMHPLQDRHRENSYLEIILIGMTRLGKVDGDMFRGLRLSLLTPEPRT